jgi:pimeloyl-ACP methyl ester carboxylesterase
VSASRENGNELLAVDETGAGEPLVLIHGLATTREIWSLVVPALARQRRVITLDVPGFGTSPPAGARFELDQVAERILDGLGSRGIEGPFDLAGHSLGAGIAVTLAATRPDLVRGLILVAPAGLHPRRRLPASVLAPAVTPMFAIRRRLAPLTDFALGRQVLLAMAVADASSVSPTQARMMVEASSHATRIADAFATIAATDLRPRLDEIKAPLGLIWGERDVTIPVRGARHVRAARPDALLEVIPGAGHVPMVEKPDAFARSLQRLLQRLPKDATTLDGVAPNLR